MDKAGVIIATHGEEGELDWPSFSFRVQPQNFMEHAWELEERLPGHSGFYVVVGVLVLQ